jgi:hypothetical protein
MLSRIILCSSEIPVLTGTSPRFRPEPVVPRSCPDSEFLAIGFACHLGLGPLVSG